MDNSILQNYFLPIVISFLILENFAVGVFIENRFSSNENFWIVFFLYVHLEAFVNHLSLT